MNLTISIGEPWDFKGPDGHNKMKGKVVFEINNRALIFKSDKKQKFDEGEGTLFLFSSRYVGENLVNNNEKNEKRYYGTFGAGLLKDDADYQNKSKEQLEKESKYVFIGSFGYKYAPK